MVGNADRFEAEVAASGGISFEIELLSFLAQETLNENLNVSYLFQTHITWCLEKSFFKVPSNINERLYSNMTQSAFSGLPTSSHSTIL